MVKKVLTVLLVLLAVVPLTVWGTSRANVNAAIRTWFWDFDEATHTLTISGTGKITDFNSLYENLSDLMPWYDVRDQIEEIIIESGITVIGSHAFYGTAAKSVKIPNTVTEIGDYAFYECTNLNAVKMPDSITEIGGHSFYNCSKLEFLTLSNSLKVIDNYAFYNCTSLKEITFPNSLININERAFWNCTGLTHITIPGSVRSVGDSAFTGCAATVIFNEGLEMIGKTAFCDILNETLIIPDSVIEIDQYAFSNCKNLTKVVTGTNLVKIGSETFKGIKSLTSVDFSKSQNLQSIGASSFQGTNITSAIIPDSVTNIGDSAFSRCAHLTELKLPRNLTAIKGWTFAYTAIESVYIPENVLSIEDHAFCDCTDLKKIVIPHNVTNINGVYAFGNCKSLTAVDISGSDLTIASMTFEGSKKIDHVHIPNGFEASDYAGKYGLPKNESYYFKIGPGGKCPSALCPFRDDGAVVGDVSGDGKLNNTDIIMLGRSYMEGIASKFLAIADMNGDGKITNADIIMLGRYYMSLIT